MDEMKLLPCPFCAAEVKTATWEGHWGWAHPSNGCFLQHYDPYDYTTEAEAIAAWNQRADTHPAPTADAGLVERLRACPNINHARIAPVKREVEHIIPAALLEEVIAYIAATQGEGG